MVMDTRRSHDFVMMDRARACTRKIPYRSRWKAVLAEFSAEARTGDDHEAYRCRHCGKWHIGHARRISK